jgi:hypothetical protein
MRLALLLMLSCVPPEALPVDPDAGTPDAGSDAPDAGSTTPPVTVVATLHWSYETSTSSCAVDGVQHSCTASASMTEDAFTRLATPYSACSFSGQQITCVNCSPLTLWCGPMPGGRYKTTYQCSHLTYTGYGDCTWTPPAN